MESVNQKREFPHPATWGQMQTKKRERYLCNSNWKVTSLVTSREKEEFFFALQQSSQWEILTTQPVKSLYTWNSQFPPMNSSFITTIPTPSSLKEDYSSPLSLYLPVVPHRLNFPNCNSLLFLNKPILLVKWVRFHCFRQTLVAVREVRLEITPITLRLVSKQVPASSMPTASLLSCQSWSLRVSLLLDSRSPLFTFGNSSRLYWGSAFLKALPFPLKALSFLWVLAWHLAWLWNQSVSTGTVQAFGLTPFGIELFLLDLCCSEWFFPFALEKNP